MLDLAMLIIHDLEFSNKLTDKSMYGRCQYCSGLDPALAAIRKEGEKVGHGDHCKIALLNREYMKMLDYL